MYNFECRDNEEFCDNEKMLKKQFIYNLLIAWCVRKQTATNLIEPKVWPLLWMGWQEILHEMGHPHLARAIRGWSMPSADGMGPRLAPNRSACTLCLVHGQKDEIRAQ